MASEHRSGLAQGVESLLTDLLDVHRALLVTAEEHRAALRTADGSRVERAAERSLALHERVALLDARRRELVARHPIPGVSPERIRLSDLALSVGGAEAERLLALAEETRAVMARVNDEHRTIRAASQTLLAHLEGLMRQVGQTLSHARTYSRKGFVEAGVPIVSSLDLAC